MWVFSIPQKGKWSTYITTNHLANKGDIGLFRKEAMTAFR